MARVLGIDTSNYTTSVCLYDTVREEIRQEKKLLPVKDQAIGLKQSDAVFHHTVQRPERMEALALDGPVDAIGVSTRPRSVKGSYMPCFLVGEGTARSIAAATHAPLFRFSHQDGHVMAALYSSGSMEMLDGRFLAFHVSGGTTEALLVTPQGDGFGCECVAKTLDLNAGQVIDRVGVMLGLSFPAGRGLDALASECPEEFRVKPAMKGVDCCLSGLQNQCEKRFSKGEERQAVAKYCLCYVAAALEEMTAGLLQQYGPLPLLYAGGVMSNSYIRARFTKRFSARFADPAFSSDNAAGVALLAARAFLAKNPS